MTKNLKFFFIALILSLPFWWALNIFQPYLENFFYRQELAHNPRILTAQANQLAFEESVKNLRPFRYGKAEELTLTAKGAISLLINDDGQEKTLFEKNIAQSLPIASLTKLMTAYVILKEYDLTKEIKISKEAVNQEESLGKLRVGDILLVEQLLYPLLMESSNDAAFALVNDYDGMTQEIFVELMNLETKSLGLVNTHFINVTGLDNDNLKETNYSSAYDLTILAKELLKSPLVWQILTTPKINLYGQELVNTNKFLGKMNGVIGGKTGYTEKALGCFLLVIEAPQNNGYLINVILGAGDRFAEIEKLIGWVNQSYQW